MYEYKVVWINEHIDARSGSPAYTLGQTNEVINEFARHGWEPMSVVPGTNAQTYGGLFVTLRKLLSTAHMG